MRNRILSIALALSMLAVAFVALPTTAAVDYTGSVTTTDDTGTEKTVFFRGEPVYVNVELKYLGLPYVADIGMELLTPTGGTVSWMWDRTNDPVDGWYNSSEATPVEALWTGAWFDGDVIVYDVVVSLDEWPWVEFARTQITVKKEGLTLDPPSGYYYPGQDVMISYMTSQTEDFYLEVVNATGYELENVTNQEAFEGWWGMVWQIDEDAPDGMFWLRIRAELNNDIWENVTIWIQKYDLYVTSDRWNYLVGEDALLTYIAYDMATGVPVANVDIEWAGQYYNVSGNLTNISGTLEGASGTEAFEVPSDIALWSDVYLTFWANESGTDRTSVEYRTIYVALLQADVDLDSGPYMPGDLVQVYVEAWVGWDWLPGAEVDIEVDRNGTVLDAYGATDLTTDVYGSVTHTFRLLNNAAKGNYVVTATVTKAGQTATYMATFEVEWAGWIVVQFDKDYYYGGETATVGFRTIWNNNELAGEMVSYTVWIGTGLLMIGNTTSDEVSIDIPSSYYGWIEVDAEANLDGYFVYGMAWEDVYFADIVLSVDRDRYRPGETLTFSWELITGLTAANLEYEIRDEDGVKVADEAVPFATSGSFTYTVPEGSSSDTYEATMILMDGAGGYADASIEVDMMPAYELSIWAEKSSYASGAFKPGQTVTVHYAITTQGLEHLPVYMIWFWFSYDPVGQSILVSSPEGTFEYSIPDDAPAGNIGIYAYLYDGADPVDYISYDSTLVTVNNNLSGWDKAVAGMSAIDFTLLVLIVIMILLLIVVPLLKSWERKPKEPKVEPAPPPESKA